jgi:hypothetical protein
MSSITSADGTTISYDRAGNGPPVILVLGAFNDRATGSPLAAHLSATSTAVEYPDRRAASSTPVDQGELGGMPEPAVLRLHASDGQVLVTWGRTLVYHYEAEDLGMRNLAIVALTDPGRRVDEGVAP